MFLLISKLNLLEESALLSHVAFKQHFFDELHRDTIGGDQGLAFHCIHLGTMIRSPSYGKISTLGYITTRKGS